MPHDRQQQAGFKTDRHHARREWENSAEHEHQMEARDEHARQPGRVQRVHQRRAAEAERQIRELRARY
jgi:hypothetical protein